MSIYNNIPAMVCKCQDTAELDEILRQLKEWGVPDHCAQSLFLGDILISWEENGLITYRFQGSIFNVKEVSPSDFLSAFREVYEASNGVLPVVDKGIVFPDGEWLNSIFTTLDSAEIKIAMFFAIEKHKQKIIELNPHLKV